jgi:hypothetical protein
MIDAACTQRRSQLCECATKGGPYTIIREVESSCNLIDRSVIHHPQAEYHSAKFGQRVREVRDTAAEQPFLLDSLER